MEKIIIKDKYLGERVDKCMMDILSNLGIKIPSRSFLQSVLDRGILVNNSSIKGSYKLKNGDIVEVDKEYFLGVLKDADLSRDIIPQKGKLDIIYENNDYIVLNKPKGVVVHPGEDNKNDTLSNYVRWYLEQKGEYDPLVDRGGIVHRLDKGVSGLMVVAKNKEMQDFLKQQFKKHEVKKIYKARTKKFKESRLDMLDICEDFEVEDDIISNYNWLTVKGFIGRSSVNRLRMEFKLYEFAGSKLAISHFLKVGEEEYLIRIDTGRMHQIRATFEYLGRYIIGDNLYKPRSRINKSDKIALESVYLSFIDISGKRKIFSLLK